MNADTDDLAILCRDMTKEEVDRLHRLLHEWGTGPADSFPTQFSLLTRAQLRAAASIPRAIADSRKWLELHLAEYRRQTNAMVDDFSSSAKQQATELKTAVELHAKITQQAAERIQVQLNDVEVVGRRIKSLMDCAASEWKVIKVTTTDQCKQLAQVSNDLQDRFAWRKIIWWAAWTLVAFVLGYCLAINSIH